MRRMIQDKLRACYALLTQCFCLFSLASAMAQAPSFEWAVKAGGTLTDWANAIAIDAATNLYVTGPFSGTATFGSTNITVASTNISQPNIFLAKYNRAGIVQWVRALGGCCLTDWILTGIALDGGGNIYMAGRFRGVLSMGGFTNRSDYSEEIFVAKLSNNGTVLWLEQGGDAFRDQYCSGMAADSNGNVYITGNFNGTATFGNVTLDANGNSSVFQVKYGPFGNVIWARKLGPRTGHSGYSEPGIVAAIQDGNSYWTGRLSGELDFDGIIATNRSDTNQYATFIAKYNSIGTAVQVITIDGVQSGYVGPNGLQFDSDANMYVAGNLGGTARFDNQIVTNSSGGGFLAKYNPAGTLAWITLSTNVNSYGLALDGAGNAYVTGDFGGYAYFDRIRLQSTGSRDLFVAKYDVTGAATWAKRAGGNGYTYSVGIAVDPGGASYLTGNFGYGTGFDNIVLTAAGPSGNPDVLLAKLSSGAPIITSQPQNQTVAIGGTANFSVSANNNPLFTYQWQFEGTNLVGETNATLAITNVQSANEGPYRVLVANGAGTTVSEWATLILIAPLAITAQPQSQTVVAGTNATFSVTASGTAPLTYRWQFGGTNLAGATNMTLAISNVQPAKAGNYSVVVTNSQGVLTSSVAILTVRYSLTVNSNGDGTVTRNPNFPIYPPNLSVTLTATASPGGAFRNWSGDASGSTNPLTIVMTTNKTITAIFVSTAVSVAIVGVGAVTKSPDQPYYNAGDSVTLTATAGRWYAFTGWGDGVTANPRVVTIGTNNNYTAVFSPTTAVETLTFSNVSRVAPVGMPAILVDGQFVLTGAVTRLGSAEIEMLTTFPNGAVFYTLNGLAPTFNSSLYIVPFTVARSATIRAVAWDANFVNSWEADPVSVIIEPAYTLNATTAGGGTINLLPMSASYASNTSVTVAAAPAPGWKFLQWLGDASGTNATQTVVMTRDKCVEAVFGTSLGAVATTGGAVTQQPDVPLYPYGTLVRLTAMPDVGNYFVLWGNAGTGTNSPLLYTVTDSNRTVSAAFAPLSAGKYALSVLTDGFGAVTNNPRGSRFNSGQTVSLFPVPDPDQQFLAWAGDATGAQSPLTVVMNSSKVITAQFTKRPRLSFPPCVEAASSEDLPVWLTGEWGEGYAIESAPDVTGPWTPFLTVTNQLSRTQFLVPSVTNGPARFYRIRNN